MSYLAEHDAHTGVSGWSYSVFTISKFDGTIEVNVCDVCEYMIVICLHTTNSWDNRGTRLTCDLCGADGT